MVYFVYSIKNIIEKVFIIIISYYYHFFAGFFFFWLGFLKIIETSLHNI